MPRSSRLSITISFTTVITIAIVSFTAVVVGVNGTKLLTLHTSDDDLRPRVNQAANTDNETLNETNATSKQIATLQALVQGAEQLMQTSAQLLVTRQKNDSKHQAQPGNDHHLLSSELEYALSQVEALTAQLTRVVGSVVHTHHPIDQVAGHTVQELTRQLITWQWRLAAELRFLTQIFYSSDPSSAEGRDNETKHNGTTGATATTELIRFGNHLIATVCPNVTSQHLIPDQESTEWRCEQVRHLVRSLQRRILPRASLLQQLILIRLERQLYQHAIAIQRSSLQLNTVATP